jgi:drug/metabolite transporter (DMT)-like permease
LSSYAKIDQLIIYTLLNLPCAPTMNSTNLKAHAALLAVNTIYAINFVVAKEVMPAYIQPFGFIIIRVGVATLLFWLTAILWQRHKKGYVRLAPPPKSDELISPYKDDTDKKHWLLAMPFIPMHQLKQHVSRKDAITLLVCSCFGVAINQMLFFKGLANTSPIHGALIMITTPILVLLIASILKGGERFSRQKIAGILLGLGGAAMIILQGVGGNQPSNATPFGDFCIFLNAASYGLYLVLAKPLMARFHFLFVTKWTFLLGFFIVLPFGWHEFTQIAWHTFSPFIWACVGYVVFMVTFMAYLLNSYALRTVNASVVSTYIYTQPLLTTIIALILGKDAPNLYTLLAGLCIFIGVYWTSKQR